MKNLLILGAIGGLVWWNRAALFGTPTPSATPTPGAPGSLRRRPTMTLPNSIEAPGSFARKQAAVAAAVAATPAAVAPSSSSPQPQVQSTTTTTVQANDSDTFGKFAPSGFASASLPNRAQLVLAIGKKHQSLTPVTQREGMVFLKAFEIYAAKNPEKASAASAALGKAAQGQTLTLAERMAIGDVGMFLGRNNQLLNG